MISKRWNALWFVLAALVIIGCIAFLAFGGVA